MNCNTCSNTKCIPQCFDTLIIGTIEEVDTEVNIYLKDTTINRIFKYDGTSSSYGVVSWVRDEDSITLSPNHNYELWVTLTTAEMSEPLTLTIGETSATCFNLNAERTEGDFPEVTLQEV